MIKLSSIFNSKLWNQNNYFSFNSYAVVVVGVLLIAVISLTLLCIVLPLMMTNKKDTLRNTGWLFTYFASIGLGFMLIEISQIQRLTLFLGNPTYGLSVVLFTLLLSSGLGSLLASKIAKTFHASILSLAILPMILGLFGYVSPYIISHYQISSTLIRVVTAMIILFPIGLFMGIALPLGMQLTNTYSKNLTPWLWGINGAMSICGSVLAIAIALSSGISASFWVGVVCYFIAVSAYGWLRCR